MTNKWEKCQVREREWWLRWKKRSDLKAVKAELIERANRLKKSLPQTGRPLKILQIGPAANGEIHFLAGERFAIDPLASFFKENFGELIDPEVNFVDGLGEKLPYADSYFDAVLILNVLDHCAEPVKVMREIERALAPGGRLVP